jgi:hypothetical protein
VRIIVSQAAAGETGVLSDPKLVPSNSNIKRTGDTQIRIIILCAPGQ